MKKMGYNTGVFHLNKRAVAVLSAPHGVSNRTGDTVTMTHSNPNSSAQPNIPYGYCHCGCGQLAPIAKKSNARNGHVRGEPVRFISGHQFSQFRNQFRPLSELFWLHAARADPETCWVWEGPKLTNGYGHFKRGDIKFYAHRVSYELHHGPIPDGMLVCHTCDNPPCVNPAHLFAGTFQDNNRDRHTKGRSKGTFPSGAAHPGAKLSDADVKEILSLRDSGLLQREIAERFGVSRTTISSIWLGKTYRFCANAAEAKAAMLKLERKEEDGTIQ